MSDLDRLLPLWQELRDAGTEFVLATVVHVEGSGYRKPGARMLVAADGRKAGTISGGCLEGEVARKAFWRTENGPVLRRISTHTEDGEVPFGMGCGGVIHLLLERSSTASPLLEKLAQAFSERKSLSIATVIEGTDICKRTYIQQGAQSRVDDLVSGELQMFAQHGYDDHKSFSADSLLQGNQAVRVWIEFRKARPGLFVFGAGDDAIPLVRQARQIGWHVTVADGRSNLVTGARFPDADELLILLPGEIPYLDIRPTDAAAVMTHSLVQDTRIVPALLKQTLAYIGILGPRHRTQELLATIAGQESILDSQIKSQVSQWMSRIHAPMGLDLGGDTPPEIALAAIAEIQRALHRASGKSLRELVVQSKELTVGAVSPR